MRVVTSYNNFARAKIDHDMNGRFDLPIFSTGTDAFLNWVSNFKGNALFRTGFEDMTAFQDCAFVEFKFSQNQNYILVLYNLKMRFLSYDTNGDFGWVLSGGVPLEVTTPWTLAQAKTIARQKKSCTQNFDVMIMTHNALESQKLIRTAANAFTLRPYARKDDPFPLTWAATKAITGVTAAAQAVVTCVGHGYSVGDRVLIDTVTGMTELNKWTAAILAVGDANHFTIDVDTTTFTAYTANGTAAKVLTGDYPATCLFTKGRLKYGGTRLKYTTVYESEAAQYYIHTLPATVTDASALQYTIADITQPIEWMIQGSNSMIVGAADGIIAVNGGGVGQPITSATVDANITPAPGCNSAEPLLKDGFLFYVGQNGRNAHYFNYDVLTETFLAQDANIISYDISATGFSKIRSTKDKNNLMHALRGNGDWCTMNFNQPEKIIGWHEHTTTGDILDIAQISDNSGNQQFFGMFLRNGAYYIERQAAYVEFKKRSDFFTQPASNSEVDRRAAVALDDKAYARYVAEQLKGCIFVDNATVFSDLKESTGAYDATITYNAGAGTITAAAMTFVVGDVGKHIVYKTATGYESGRFLITAYISATVVTVSVLQTPTANVYTSWYLTFNQLTGLARFNTYEVAVVTDGGFLDDYTVSGGVIDLPNQVTHAVVGYKYRGFIESFNLGFVVQGENTQTTMKDIFQFGVRAVNSVGLKVGATPYKLEPVQELSQGDLNYLPPLPVDGTKYITYSDDHQRDKKFCIVQDEPGPGCVTAVMVDASYAFTR